MSHRRLFLIVMASLAAGAPAAHAQRGGRGAAPAAGSIARPIDITASNSFDMAQVVRGGKIFAAQCSSCHGENARGGKTTKTDVDLLRSDLVVMDHGGRELPEFLKTGRPEKSMPKFDLAHDDGVDLAIWLHYQVSLVTLWNQYTRPSVFTGDAAKGEAFFNGSVGRCSNCHSVTGDLKGIGQKNNNDAGNLQAAILGGGGRGGRGGGVRGAATPPSPNVVASVTLANGEKFSGAPVLLNDFVVEIRMASGENKTWLRNGEWPKVTQTNRLQAHIDLMFKYTDADIHNLAAYLKDK